MRNPFQKPEQVQRFLKIAAEGPIGGGKTVFGLLAKEAGLGPVAVISGEQGEILYINHPRWGGFDRLPTQTIDGFAEGVSYLESDDNPYKTLVIDTVTNLYEALVAAKMSDDGEVSMQEWGPIKRKFKELMTRVVNLPMNIVYVVHENDIIERKGMDSKVVGQKADVEKSFGRNPDVVVRLYIDRDGTTRKALIKKDRTGTFQAGQVIDDPHIKMWVGGIRAEGKQEKQLTPDELRTANEAALLTPEQETFRRLMRELDEGAFTGKATLKDWAEKAKADIDTLPDARRTDVRKAFKALLAGFADEKAAA